MTTLYKKGSQYKIRFGGVDYDVDIIKSKDDAELAKLKKSGWCSSLPETVKPTKKAEPKKTVRKPRAKKTDK